MTITIPYKKHVIFSLTLTILTTINESIAFSPVLRFLTSFVTLYHKTVLNVNQSDSSSNNSDDAESLRLKAEQLREQIRSLEEKLPRSSKLNNNDEYILIKDNKNEPKPEGKSLKDKRVLIVGANGRLGSMVTRYILRNHPEVKEVVAAVHYVGEATTRGYGRLSYEVGAEDGIGTIGAAWSPEEERNARFEFSDEMKDYNLQNLVRWSFFL